MYKVFLNDRMITFTTHENITLNKTTYIFDDLCTVEEVENWFSSFVKSEVQEAILVHSIPEKFFDLFRSVFVNIQSAGGAVFRENKLLFILKNKKWDLPKGKIDKGETAKEAAIREVEEECGISNHQIIKQLLSTYHIYKSPYEESKGSWIFKETFWFEMNYLGDDLGNPQLNEGITKVKWFARNKLDGVCVNTYENLKQIISIYRD